MSSDASYKLLTGPYILDREKEQTRPQVEIEVRAYKKRKKDSKKCQQAQR